WKNSQILLCGACVPVPSCSILIPTLTERSPPMNTKRIVLPGHGTPTTFTVKEDSVIGVFANGRLINVSFKANVPTRVEFLGSLSRDSLNLNVTVPVAA